MTQICKNIDDFYFVVYDLYDTPILFYQNVIEFKKSFNIALKEIIRKMNNSKDNYFMIFDGTNLRRVYFFR